MKKIKFVRTYSCDYTLVTDENGEVYYSDDRIMDIEKRLIDHNIDFEKYYYGSNSDEKLTIEEMKEQFDDFEYEVQFLSGDDSNNDDEIWSYTLELVIPTEFYIEESEI